MENVNYAYNLLTVARNSEEIDDTIPLGFKLNVTEKQFENHVKQLVKNNNGEFANMSSFETDYFGWKQKVYVSSFPYFSDPNTKTDTISSVTFVFDELNSAPNSKIVAFRDSISKKFDNSWQVVEYQLDTEKPDQLSNYFKYWIKNNIVAEFAVDTSVTLEFHNAPKSYTFDRTAFYDEIKQFYARKDEVDRILKEKESKPKIVNSPWDGSVYQVKNYLQRTLKDPKSYEGIEWSEVNEKDGFYFVRHKYRAKNSFGGYVIESQVFKLDDNGNVIDAHN